MSKAGSGSSPHTRGTPSCALDSPGQGRFIPAHAGNTDYRGGIILSLSVHPRTRGEHLYKVVMALIDDGSSPHTRGTRKTNVTDPKVLRFIPAHAGNTRGGRPCLISSPVHPRTRGEHQLRYRHNNGPAGSSPHTRGTHRSNPCHQRCERFIPAHAGNTT